MYLYFDLAYTIYTRLKALAHCIFCVVHCIFYVVVEADFHIQNAQQIRIQHVDFQIIPPGGYSLLRSPSMAYSLELELERPQSSPQTSPAPLPYTFTRCYAYASTHQNIFCNVVEFNRL